jgi:hypothetical protein
MQLLAAGSHAVARRSSNWERTAKCKDDEHASVESPNKHVAVRFAVLRCMHAGFFAALSEHG